MNAYAVQSLGFKRRVAVHFGVAWLALCVALAIHVIDEASTDFLSVYNPAVRTIRAQLPFIPLPTFSFSVWLSGLIAAVVVLSLLSPFAFRGARAMASLSYVFGFLMLGNGLLHIGASVYMGRAMPGVYSSPLLLVCSSYLLLRVSDYRRRQR